MKRYIALLRGISISGKNKVPMAKLRKCFESLGVMEVKTCLNSGNVIFSSTDGNVTALTDRAEYMMQCEFGLDIFILPPATFSDVYHEIGAPKEGLEQIQEYQSVVFWSFSRKNYKKTNWWPKTARVDIGWKLTIRTANTVRKIVNM